MLDGHHDACSLGLAVPGSGSPRWISWLKTPVGLIEGVGMLSTASRSAFVSEWMPWRPRATATAPITATMSRALESSKGTSASEKRTLPMELMPPNVAGTVPIVRLQEFLPDTQRIGQGVQVVYDSVGQTTFDTLTVR